MSAFGSVEGTQPSGGGTRALVQSVARFFGNVAGPALAAILTLRFVFPTRLAGAAGGVSGFLAWLADQYPLFTGVALFIGFSETGRYWQRRWYGLEPGEANRRSVNRWLVALAAVAACAFLVRSSVAATFRVVGPSMLPTLEMGDRVLVDRLAYGVRVPLSKKRLAPKAPSRGELVVFRANGLTGANGPQSVVKRVMAMPGDRISVQQGGVYINDWRVPACDAGPYIAFFGKNTVRGRLVVEYLGDKTYLTVRKAMERPFEGYTVKPGEVFVMGDDRGMSSDSRAWSEGNGTGVPVDALEGRVSRILLGARPDGRLDFSRLISAPLDLKVRLPGFDMSKTDERIASCLKRRPASTWPPGPAGVNGAPTELTQRDLPKAETP